MHFRSSELHRESRRWVQEDFMRIILQDRTNIGNARIGGLQKALNITDAQYSLSLTVTYSRFQNKPDTPQNREAGARRTEPPTKPARKAYIGPHILMPTMVVSWGIVATLQGLVKNYRGLLAARFFLGLCEAGGLLPGVSLYIASFYPRSILQLRLALLFTATSLAGAFSGLLASGILHMDGIGGLDGWAWIFILEGILTVIIGIGIAFILPSSIRTAKYLTLAEKDAAESALFASHGTPGVSRDSKVNAAQVIQTLTSPHLWLMCPLFFFNGTRLFGLAVFAPSIVNALIGNHPVRAQLLTVPPYAVAFVTCLAAAFVSDRWGRRGACTIVFSTISIVGYAIFLRSHNRAVNYFALFLQTVGAYGVPPAITAWTANNFAPHYKRATALAIVLILSVAGGILSTWIFTDPPRYARATTINLAFSVAEVVFAVLNILYLRRLNHTKQHEKKTKQDRAGVTEKGGEESGSSDADADVRKEVDDRDAGFLYTL
ncbi:MFS general substrate transporter [Exidia glandulosa HHB12029]|uniref:MFS general substrate transporter n=1 Tax=Exidia glandulosa HHB12029 TaxID=1314781 RepID=A0A165KMZ7_EXIGL|nr:MFS general substrate transporter [Exidia glandulosa HHB12029]